jgi:twinkle protein
MNEASAYIGIEQRRPEHNPREYKAPLKPKGMKSAQNVDEAAAYLAGRGLSQETIKAFKICGDNETIYFPFIHGKKANMIKSLKIKRIEGKKDCRITSSDQMPCLFGWQTVSPKAREVVICEGEINAMSVKQVGHDALAVPIGAGGGNKQAWVENEYDNLECFDTIYLWFDNDQAGKEAIPELLARLGCERCRMIDSPIDANDALLNGLDFAKMAKLKVESKEQHPESLSRMNEYADKAWKEINNPMAYAVGFKLPWNKCGDSFIFRAGEVTVLTGVNSHGKSAGIGQITIGVMAQGAKVCVASMESRPHKWSVKMLCQYCSMNNIPLPKNNKPVFNEMWGWFNSNLFAYSSPGQGVCNDILEVFRYARKRYGVTFFVLDNLSALDVALDDYEGQRNFVQRLVNFAKTEDVHVIFVAHQRKPLSEKEAGDRFGIKGSGALSDLVDNVLVWWRNKAKEKKVRAGEAIDHNEADVMLICDKQRETGVERSFKLWFHYPTATFFETPEIYKESPENETNAPWAHFD